MKPFAAVVLTFGFFVLGSRGPVAAQPAGPLFERVGSDVVNRSSARTMLPCASSSPDLIAVAKCATSTPAQSRHSSRFSPETSGGGWVFHAGDAFFDHREAHDPPACAPGLKLYEIRMLGERFGIPTEFTSYLVLEPGMVAGNMRQDTTRMRRGEGRVSGTGVSSGIAGGRVGAAPAPAAPTIQVAAARAAAEQRSAKSVAAADAATLMDADARRVGTRMFHRDGERWIDSRMKSDLRVYKVKAYSPAYFALIEKLPELRDAFAIGDRVVVAGRSVAVEVVEDAAELSASELESIVRNW